MKTWGVGIVGFGWAAGAHLAAYRKTGRFAPVAIMSRRPLDPAGLPDGGEGIMLYSDYDAFLADPRVEVVDICTEHALHARQAIRAAQAGKHLVLEKPMALSLADAENVARAVRDAGVRSSVCFEVRFLSAARAHKALIDQGLVGDIYLAECDYLHGIGPSAKPHKQNELRSASGSSLLTAGLHALDLLLHLTGGDVEEVFSYPTRNPDPRYASFEYPTTTLTLLKFRGRPLLGKVASVTDCPSPYFFNIHLVGSEGALRNDLFFSRKVDGMRGWSRLDVQLPESGDVASHPYADQFAHFAACLDAGVEPHNGVESALATHRVVFAADESAASGKPVRLG